MFRSVDFHAGGPGEGPWTGTPRVDSPTFKPIRSLSLDFEARATPSPRATAPPMFFSDLQVPVPDESEERDQSTDDPDEQQRALQTPRAD